MSRFPVGPPLKSMGETSRDVPPPLVLNVALAINCLVFFIACFLILFLHPQNAFPAFGSGQAAGIVLFGLIGSVATVWSISSSRGLSRYFILINTIGVAAVCLTLHFGARWQDQSFPSLLIMSGVVLPTLWVLFGNQTVRVYYRVIAGRADRSELTPSTETENRWLDRMGNWITFGAEAFIVVIALFALIYPMVAEK